MSQPQTILAAALKSKKLAVAIFFGERLIYYRSSGLASKENGSDHLAAEKIENLIRTYKPDYLATEELVYKQQQIPAITNLRRKVIKISQKRGLMIKSYTPGEVRSSFCSGSKSINTEQVKILVSHYPELKKFVRGQSERQINYRQILFKAIAVGFCCARNTSPAQTSIK